MQFLQGTFLNRDVNGDGSTCLKFFRFEGISFRQHDTGMSHKEAYRSSFFSNPTEPDAAERKMIPVPPMNSPQTCKSSLRAGLFKTAAASFGFMRKSSFKLELKIPIYDTDPHANKEKLRQDMSLEGGTYSYEDETIDCHLECPAIKCKFLDGSVEVFQKGEISTIFSEEEERPRYAELLDGHQYTGNISIFDTTCTISMDFTPLNARNLVYFTAATTECKIGSMLAPEMPREPTQKYPSESCQLPKDCGPWWAVQNIDKLRHDSPFPPPSPDSVTFRRQQGNCGKCGSETVCINTTLQYPTVSGVIFNFTCACNHGFVFQSTTHTDRMDCVDFDECTKQTHECHQLATCVNTYGSYACTCMAGAEGNGPEDNPQCACKRGFILSGSSCSDLQECVEKAHNCHRHAACTNTYGSFYCACNKGFVNAVINASQIANASQVANSTQGMGLSCIPASKVWIERAWQVGNGLGWDITWSIENAPNVMDVISVFKIDNVVIAWDAQGLPTFGEVPSLLYWVHPSATVNTNSLAASCTQIPPNCFTVACYLPCQTPGSPDNQEWRKGSLQFKSTSLGIGKYRAVLFSMDVKEVTAIYDYDIKIENVGDARTMGGGVQGCNGLYIGSRCCQNTTMCVVLPDRLDPYNRPQDNRLPKRCGDGRLELYAPPQETPMTTDQERDGRIEECDDGKNDDGDGCDANCRIEPNTNCNYYNSPLSLQKGVCCNILLA
jgi:cysteine-rich repeat protein